MGDEYIQPISSMGMDICIGAAHVGRGRPRGGEPTIGSGFGPPIVEGGHSHEQAIAGVVVCVRLDALALVFVGAARDGDIEDDAHGLDVIDVVLSGAGVGWGDAAIGPDGSAKSSHSPTEISLICRLEIDLSQSGAGLAHDPIVALAEVREGPECVEIPAVMQAGHDSQEHIV